MGSGGTTRRPPPAGRPNYAARRAGAVVVLAVAVLGVVRLVGALFGEDSPGSLASIEATAGASAAPAPGEPASGSAAVSDAEPGTSTRSEVEPDVADGATSAGPATDPGAPSETAATDPPSTGPPTPTDPAEVHIVGDSDAGTFGPYLQSLLDTTLVVDSVLDYEVSSGLARPDFYDWPARLRRTLPDADPDIVVATFGGNDAQPLTVAQEEFEVEVAGPIGNEEEWAAAYERRVGEVMDLLLEDGRRVVWVGIPNASDPELTARFVVQDRAAKAAADARSEVVFVDTWNRFTGRDGGYADFVVDPRDGIGKDVRRSDGFHLNQAGAEILAVDIAYAVQEELREMGADL
ncbi:DUF459 domain-containing protein [Ilumatobacter sp.]|uniref:DUF459 domain-containing protein n=1 Tax=Ilumatobacter sp. TaxID=1967498 RepID=UPI003B52EA4D